MTQSCIRSSDFTARLANPSFVAAAASDCSSASLKSESVLQIACVTKICFFGFTLQSSTRVLAHSKIVRPKSLIQTWFRSPRETVWHSSAKKCLLC